MDIRKLIGSKASVPSIDFNQVVKSDNLRYWRISKATWEKDTEVFNLTHNTRDWTFEDWSEFYLKKVKEDKQ